MSEHTDREVYVLRHLKACGLGGQPFSNLVAGSPIPVKELHAVLEKLADEKLIKISGPKSLADLKSLIDDAGDIAPPMLTDEKGGSWVGSNVLVFNEKSGGSSGFFKTDIRLTLRGHAALAFEQKKPTPLQVVASRKVVR